LRGVSKSQFDSAANLVFVSTVKNSFSEPPSSLSVVVTSIADVVTSNVLLLESVVAVNYDVSFTVIGTSSLALEEFDIQSTSLRNSISSGNFTT